MVEQNKNGEKKLNFIEKLQTYLDARYPIILIETTEEDRLMEDLGKVRLGSIRVKPEIMTWSSASGMKLNNEEYRKAAVNLGVAIDACNEYIHNNENKAVIFVFYDIIASLKEASSQRKLKEFAIKIREGYRCNCILISDTSEIVGSINSEITVLDYPKPSREEVYEKVKEFAEQWKNDKKVEFVDTSPETLSALTNAALGLNNAEIQNCLARALVEDHRLDINDVKSIIDEKKQIIRKSGILEYIENKQSLEDVGGLNVLKRWLELRGRTFSDDAKAFGLNPPKGVLLVGVPGCGKSLTAKCIASAWNMPLLKLDMGKIFGKYVGDSEANIRQALKTAEAIAPCVLWIDEIEKGMSGGGNDGGTSSRVFGNILTWMQDKISPVFTFATANNIRNLPPELLRKGRFDEIFFVDLPDFEERKKILEIHINKTGRSLKKFDIDKLAKLSGEENLGEGIRLSGAEIESWVKDSLMEAYARKTSGNSKADLSMEDFEIVLKRMVPMAKMRQEDFKELREWANENAVSASISINTSSSASTNTLGGRKLDL